MTALLASGLGGTAAVWAQPAPTQAQPAPATVTPEAAAPRVQPFVTAPSLRAMGIEPVAASSQSTAAASPAAPAASTAGAAAPVGVQSSGEARTTDDFPWLLSGDLRPWALAYLDVETLNTLYLALPTEREVRIMLPGAALDASDRAKVEIGRYFTDNTGLASVARARQLETFNSWLADTTKKKMALTQEPWMVYQFHQEAGSTLKNFKVKVQRQSAPGLSRMASDVQKAVEQITAVMNATGSHEQKMQWYNLLLQLKDGFTLFQNRVVASDRQLLEAIERYEQENPPVARPAGQPPRNGADSPVARSVEPASSVALTPEAVQREKSPPVAAKPDNGDQGGGLAVFVGMAAVLIGLFVKMRRRVAAKTPPADRNG